MANTPTQHRAKRINKQNEKIQRAQAGKGLAANLANLGIRFSSKAINLVIGKKTNRQRN